MSIIDWTQYAKPPLDSAYTDYTQTHLTPVTSASDYCDYFLPYWGTVEHIHHDRQPHPRTTAAIDFAVLSI